MKTIILKRTGFEVETLLKVKVGKSNRNFFALSVDFKNGFHRNYTGEQLCVVLKLKYQNQRQVI